MASPAQNFTRRVYHAGGAPLPAGQTLVAYALAIATMFSVALVIGAGHGEAAVAELLGLALVPLAVARLHQVPFAQLGLIAPRPLAVIGAVVAGCGLWLVALYAAAPVVEATGREEAIRELNTHLFGGGPEIAPLLLALVVVPSFCEELTHRGLVLGGLAPATGRALAVVVSTVLFALLHIEPSRMVATAILGAAAGVSALWSGSLWPAVALHATNNAIVVVLGIGAAPWLVRIGERPESLAGACALSVLGLATVWRSGPRK